jgi:acetoacetyl-CoA reductase/3-oxoacyl-[acyl-carrier protein] reductase
MTAQIMAASSISPMIGHCLRGGQLCEQGGIIAFTRTAALELARYGITVNVVAPGFTETDMFAAIPMAIQAQIKARIPAARFAHPEEISKAVLWLVADGDYVTGQQINVNGGAHM